MRCRTAIPLLLLAAATMGCTSFEERVRAVETRQSNVETQIAELQAAQRDITVRLGQVRQELDNALQPLRTQSADRGEDLRGLLRQVTALETELGDIGSRIDRLTERVADAPAQGPARAGSALPPARGPGAPRAGTPERAASAQDDGAAQRLYNTAYLDYSRENYDLCVQGFEEYSRRFPASDRADNARYWIGMCERDRGRTEDARRAFQAVIRDYPNGDAAPNAMFYDALILHEQGRGDEAAASFRRLIETLGDVDASYLACVQLGQMGAEKPAACVDIEG